MGSWVFDSFDESTRCLTLKLAADTAANLTYNVSFELTHGAAVSTGLHDVRIISDFFRTQKQMTMGVNPPTSASTENEASSLLVACGHDMLCSTLADSVATSTMVRGFGNSGSQVPLRTNSADGPLYAAVMSGAVCAVGPLRMTTLKDTSSPALIVAFSISCKIRVFESESHTEAERI